MKLQVSNIVKSYGAQDVLKGASLQVKNNEKIGLSGRNGCGKTTLLEIISGLEQADAGTVSKENGVQVGYLSQITFLDEERTVREELESVFDELKSLEKQVQAQAALLESDASEKALDKYDRLYARFEALGGYDYEYELKSVFQHFGFESAELDKKLREFSSGQRTRIALVKLLLEKPDILLLDEPTNHLDVDSIEWLENYIRHYPSAVILVSHDRMFLDHVVDEIVEIEFGKTTRWPGSYTHFVQAKKEWLEKNHDAFVRQQQEIARLESLIEKFRYKKNKAAFAQSKMKYLDRMERIEDVQADRSRMKAHFQAARRGGSRVLEVENLQAGYDKVLSTFDFELMKDQHLAIVGPNGIGKSTLVKTLVHLIPPLAGSFKFGHQIDIGYFDQDSAQMASSQTVIDELWDAWPDATQTEIRSTLAAFLFCQDDVFKNVNDLSGGERVRLALAKLMLGHDNLLILDEPTNHLDIPAREALEDALMEYDGTLLFVSHDRMFLKKMATRILEVGPESHVYDMGYEEYLEKKAANALPVQKPVRQEKAAAQPAASTKLSFAQNKAYKNRIARLEVMLEEGEQEIARMEELRFDPAYYQDYRKMEQLEADLARKHEEINAWMQEWEEKAALLEAAGA